MRKTPLRSLLLALIGDDMNRAKLNSLHIPALLLTIGLTILMALPSILHTANASKETGKGLGEETALSPTGRTPMQAAASSCTDVSFQQPTGSPVGTGTTPKAIAIADYNLDGKPDMAVANSGSDNVSILLG